MSAKVQRTKSQGRSQKQPKGVLSVSLCIFVSTLLGWTGLISYYVRYRQQSALVAPAEQTIKRSADKDALVAEQKTTVAVVPSKSSNHSRSNTVAVESQSLQSRLRGANMTTDIPRTVDSDIHVVFSTDCTPFQDWQTIVLFHSATVVGQKGPITRIASGCDDAKKEELTSLYKKLYPQYHVHFTPDFKKDSRTKQNYHFYNKPYGLQHWLNNAVPPVPDDVVVALLDPDMILIRPLTTRVRGDPSILHLSRPRLKDSEITEKVGKGQPVAQMYGLGAPWTNDHHRKFNRTKICGAGSPCLVPDDRFGGQHYAVGPPYLVQKNDMSRLTDTWTRFVPVVYEGYPHLLAEMYAYSMAAAHENLPHLQLENLMVSNTDAGGEGWPLVDKLKDACLPPENGIYYPGVPLPTVMHYCQSFRVDHVSFYKRQFPPDIFSCKTEKPLLLDPPTDFGKERSQNRMQHKRNAFALCVIHRSINAAAIDYRKRMCGIEDAHTHTKSHIVGG